MASIEAAMTAMVVSRLMELVDFYGRVRGVIDSRDENFIDDFDAMKRIRELIEEYRPSKAV